MMTMEQLEKRKIALENTLKLQQESVREYEIRLEEVYNILGRD